MWIVEIGNGYLLFGPFASKGEAREWVEASKYANMGYSVTYHLLQNPKGS